MSYRKQIIAIMTLIILLLLMMSTTIQAATVGKVYNLSAKMEGSQVKLNWSSVSGAAGYNIYVNNIRIGSVTTNEASLIGFSNNKTYSFKVAAYNSNKQEGTASAVTNLTTKAETTLGKVSDLSISQVNGYVTLSWSKVSGANRYQIFVDIPDFGEINVGEVTTTSAMLQGFTDGKKYGFSIRACQTSSSGTVNYGEKSTIKYCTIDYDTDSSDYNTENYQEKIGKVTGISASKITETTAKLSWTALSYADGYEIQLSKNYGTYKTVATKTTNSVTLSNLDPDSYYRVRILGYKYINSEKETGILSNVYSFTTLEEVSVGKVTGLTVSNITDSSAVASWTKVSGATGYNIYVYKNSTLQYTTYTSSISYTMNNLKDDTYYKIKVEAYKTVNGKEYTGTSATKGFTTLETEEYEKPATVTNLKVEVKNRNEAYLSWWPVDGATGYEVYLSTNGSSYERVMQLTDNYTILTSDMLDYATSYKVKVRAYEKYYKNSVYYTVKGEFSSVKSFKTEQYNRTQDSPNVAKVTGLSVTMNGTVASLKWNKISGASGYEIYLTIPGYGSTTLYSSTNSRTISGITGKNYDYTARVRAYKIINGVKEYGVYSDVIKFREK